MTLASLPVDGSLPLSDFLDVYLRIRAQQIKSIKAVGCCLRRMAKRLPAATVAELGRAHVSDYIAARLAEGRMAKTVNVELLNLSAALNFARRQWGWRIDNPVSGQYLREPEGRLRFLSFQEAGRLLDHSARLPGLYGDVLPDFIALALNTGLRKTELLTLTWSQVRSGRIILEPHVTKNCRRRIVPINATAAAVLDRRKVNGSPWVLASQGERIRNIYRPFYRACDLAGIEDFRIHDMRHTFASWLVIAGVPLLQVRDLLGHSSIKMTERYAHLSQDALVKAVAVLDGVCERDAEGGAAVP